MTSITSTLGIGSGIDTKELVNSLVAAQRDTKIKELSARNEKISAQISALGQVKSGLTAFSTALAQLVGGGSLSTQPTSSDTAVIVASKIAGQSVSRTPTSVEVRQLASAQALTSGTVTDPAAPVGKGTLTITLGTAATSGGVLTGFTAGPAAPIEVTIGDGDNSLTGVAAAINKANAGVTATVVNDGTGARLVLKGATGEAAAFRIDAAEDAAAPGLSRFAFNLGASTMTLGQVALDSIIAIDGLAIRRPGNSIGDVIDGVTLDLKSAVPGVPVTIGSARPTEAIGQAVKDFVEAYNELRAILTKETTGEGATLKGDAGARQVMRMLSGLTSTALTASGTPSTLAEIGVKTNRDGTLGVDTARLNAVLAASPDQVEALFNPSQSSSNPLVAIASQAGAAKPGTYEVTDLVPAAAGRLTGAAVPGAFATPLVLDATNNRFSLTLNGGGAVELIVAEGSYPDGASFAAALSAAAQAAGKPLSVGWSNDQLVLTSPAIGSGSSVTLTGTNPLIHGILGLDVPTAVAGTDASGKIGGVPAAAIGNLLFASVTSPASGLVIRPTGGVTSATISVDLGLAAALSNLNGALTGTSGSLYTSTQLLTKQSEVITEQAEKVESNATALRERLTRQFAAMDARVSAYKATQSFLDQQMKIWSNSDS